MLDTNTSLDLSGLDSPIRAKVKGMLAIAKDKISALSTELAQEKNKNQVLRNEREHLQSDNHDWQVENKECKQEIKDLKKQLELVKKQKMDLYYALKEKTKEYAKHRDDTTKKMNAT